MIAQTPTVLTLPTQDELPSDDGIPMESQRHKLQMDLLIYPLIPWLKNREDGYVGGNMFVYFLTVRLFFLRFLKLNYTIYSVVQF